MIHSPPPAGSRSDSSRALRADELELLIRVLGQSARLSFVPSDHWEFDATMQRIAYDRVGLVMLGRDEAAGLVYQKVGHAVHSHSKIDPWSVADEVVTTVEKRFARSILHPTVVIALFRMVEEERVEQIQRARYRGLHKYALPSRFLGYRQESFEADLEVISGSLHIATPMGTFWARTGLALQALAAGAEIALPEDFRWSDDMVDRAKHLAKNETCDAMLTELGALIVDIVERRLDCENEPQPSCGQEASEQSLFADGPLSEAPGESNASGASEGSSASGSPADGTTKKPRRKQNARAQSQREREIEQMRLERDTLAGVTGKQRVPVDLVADSADQLVDQLRRRLDRATKGGPRSTGTKPGPAGKTPGIHNGIPPAYHAVMRSALPMMQSIRRAIADHFLINAAGNTERHLRRGRFDAKSVIDHLRKGVRSMKIRRRVITPDERQYDVFLLVDISGSMTLKIAGEADPTVFGQTDFARWMLASQLAVGIVEALRKYPQIRIGIGTHDVDYEELHGLNQPWNTATETKLMRGLLPDGGTNPISAYRALRRTLVPRARRTLLLHLTDGEFSEGVADEIRALQRDAVRVAVLALDTPTDAAIACGVHPEDAVEVDGTRIYRSLSRIFRRLIG